MNMAKKALAVVVVAIGLMGAGCGGTEVRTQSHTTTTGQELLDLKKAYDTGVITETEYENKRKEILKRD